MKGKSMDGFILLIAVVFLILAAYIYIRRDDTEFKKYSDTADDVKINVSSLEAQTQKITESQQNFFSNTVTALENLNKRLDLVEKKDQNVSIHLKEPLSINVVYHQPKIPDVPSVISGKKPLMKRAGLLDRENN